MVKRGVWGSIEKTSIHNRDISLPKESSADGSSNKLPEATIHLEELFKEYRGEYIYHEIDTGSPIGNELW